MTNYVKIFDTTLRDGEQSPSATMTSAEKMEVARALAKLGVDIIEAGFPAASPDDLEAVRRIAIEVGNSSDGSKVPIICGLARATRNDIDKAWEAVREAKHPRIHTFLATSEIHMQYKLKMDREQVVERVIEMVSYARSLCQDVEFSPEDAGRSDPQFLYLVLGQAIKAGATTLNIPDTVGYTTPEEYGKLIAGIMKIQEKIQKLQKELNQLLGATAEPATSEAPKAKRKKGRRKMSAAAKAKMARLMKARWAKAKKAGKSKL